MIDATDAIDSILESGTFVLSCRVESWLGDTLLADDIPVAEGLEEVDRSIPVPERVTLTIPRVDDLGNVWEPSDTEHPLASFGQRLRVSLGVEGLNGHVEWLQRGWFLIVACEVSGDEVYVTAEGLLALIDEARLVTPYQPAAGSTFVSVVRDLIEPGLTVDVTNAPSNRSTPTTLAYDEERLGSLMEVLDAWPAEARITSGGYLAIVPATDSSTSVLTLTDGTGGTVVDWQAATDRDDAYTAVVARGEGADGTQVQGVAKVATGALKDSDRFNPLPVPFFYYSPLLTTNAQCTSAATAILARKSRAGSRRLAVQAVPDPRLEIGDCVTVVSERLDLDGVKAVIDSLTMPYVADGGPMTLGLRLT